MIPPKGAVYHDPNWGLDQSGRWIIVTGYDSERGRVMVTVVSNKRLGRPTEAAWLPDAFDLEDRPDRVRIQ